MPLVISSINFHTQAIQLIGCHLYHCRVLTRSELAPLRASLVPMEHCITRFFNECDPNKDKHITLKEWGHCFGLKEGKFIIIVQTNPEPCSPYRARSHCVFILKPRHSKVAVFQTGRLQSRRYHGKVKFYSFYDILISKSSKCEYLGNNYIEVSAVGKPEKMM